MLGEMGDSNFDMVAATGSLPGQVRLAQAAHVLSRHDAPHSFFEPLFWERRPSDRVSLMVHGEQVQRDLEAPRSSICDICQVVNGNDYEEKWHALISTLELDDAAYIWKQFAQSDW